MRASKVWRAAPPAGLKDAWREGDQGGGSESVCAGDHHLQATAGHALHNMMRRRVAEQAVHVHLDLHINVWAQHVSHGECVPAAPANCSPARAMSVTCSF